MKPLIINKKAYSFKTSWEELTPKEIRMVAFALSNSLTDDKLQTDYAVRIQLFKVVTNVPLKIIGAITSVQWADILPHMNWLFEAQRMKENPFPTIRIGFTRLYGPIGGSMTTSSALEFTTADEFFMRYIKTKEPEMLYLMAATLWRSKKWFVLFHRIFGDWKGDKRRSLNEINIKKRADKLRRKMGKDYLTFIFLYYRSFRQFHFAENPKFASLFKGKTYSKTTDFGWHGSLVDFSGGAFGDYKHTSLVKWKLFVMAMVKEVEQANPED